MDTVVSQCIAHGVNAGKPRPVVDVLQEKNALTRRAFAVLKRNGFLVIGSRLSVGEAPNIELLPNDATRRLIDDGTATVCVQSPGSRRWQAWLDGVRIVWTERDGS